jgi:hypothetical protein
MAEIEPELIRMFVDVIDIIHRHCSDDDVRRNIYTEMLSVFTDQTLLQKALGDDPVFDQCYRELFADESP